MGQAYNNEKGIKVESLSANPAVLTCLANDLGYEEIYSEQLRVKANKDDVLIVLSGSGNSPNVVKSSRNGERDRNEDICDLGICGWFM